MSLARSQMRDLMDRLDRLLVDEDAPAKPSRLQRALLTEGLIAVPPAMLAICLHAVQRAALWMLRDKFTPEVKARYPKHWAALRQAIRQSGLTLPKRKFMPPKDGIDFQEYPLDLSGLPASYQKLPADRQVFVLALDYDPPKGNGVAGYGNKTLHGEKIALVHVRMHAIDSLDRFPERCSAEDVPYILGFARESLEHELRHLVQHVVLQGKDPAQTAILPDYKKFGSDYYASPVEFDPQIGSTVHNFMSYWSVLKSACGAPNLTKAIKQFVGAARGGSFNSMSANEFFAHLKKRDLNMWRKAVRKFVVALQAAMAPQAA